MSEYIKNIRAAYQQVQEKLKGDQHKLDHDKDGDIDGDDFAKMRAKKKKMDEAQTECPKCKGEGCDHCDNKGYHKVAEDEEVIMNPKKKKEKGDAKGDDGGTMAEAYGTNVINAAKMYMKDSSCSYEQAAEKYGCSAEEVKKCTREMMKKESIDEAELEEGSIKGSGTDRKAQLKKAFRSGEQDTRQFNKPGGKVTNKPKPGSDKGIKRAYDKGRMSNDGGSADRGKDRSKSQDALHGTDKVPSWAKGSPGEKKIRKDRKAYALARSKPRGKLPESVEEENTQWPIYQRIMEKTMQPDDKAADGEEMVPNKDGDHISKAAQDWIKDHEGKGEAEDNVDVAKVMAKNQKDMMRTVPAKKSNEVDNKAVTADPMKKPNKEA